ncbi:MAG: sensor histidine kinase [Acutalibacteraceae bacterium]
MTAFIVIILSFGAGGFILVDTVFQSRLDGEITAAVENNQYLCTSLNAIVNSSSSSYTKYLISSFSKQISAQSGTSKLFVGEKEKTAFYDENSFVNKLKVNERSYHIVQNEEKYFVHVVSHLDFNQYDTYIETLSDITDVYQMREGNIILYRFLLLGVALFSSVLLFLFSLYLTRPLKTLSAMARKISYGDFEKRIDISSKSMQTKEIQNLSKDFNRMAEHIENYVKELKEETMRRDDFVSCFTHELKTPLTSIIGYADMLRSYDLPSEDRRNSAEYIYREGKRLEALSLHLLNLIIIKKNDFEKTAVSTEKLFFEVKSSVKFLLEKYDLSCRFDIEPCIVFAELSLLKTLIYNLIDNACKASEQKQSILVQGKIHDRLYRIVVQDNGRGIPTEEISRITEPFYMVDKSRARKQGGAGIGLALCQEIAKVHNSELTIESHLGKGTSISFDVEVYTDEK